MATRFVIIGGGPAGNTAATYAARFGAEVTLIERDVIGGAAHLWDCIPSKAMIATGAAMSFVGRSEGMGLDSNRATVDLEGLHERLRGIEARLERSVTGLLASQNVRMVRGTATLKSANQITVDTGDGIEEIGADHIVIATGSRPRIPEFAVVDGERVLSTRDAYPPKELPSVSW